VGGSPEPWAYESGFAVKWVVADQLAGKAELNYDAAKSAVTSPWIEWGPYLWTDGVKGRKDGFVYTREDVGPDGLHPSAQGQQKIAKMLLDFFKGDAATKAWFLVG
jgi:lysophospholipase L1-like esterase